MSDSEGRLQLNVEFLVALYSTDNEEMKVMLEKSTPTMNIEFEKLFAQRKQLENLEKDYPKGL